MLAALAVLASLQALEAEPTSVTVFGKERWYQAVHGDEETFVGTLERLPGRDPRNAYILFWKEGARTVSREVFVGEDVKALQPFVGRTVKITGMSVDLKVEQKMRYEIWPARVALDGADGDFIARTSYQARMPSPAKVGEGQQQVVLRSADDMLKACNNNREEVKKILQALRVDDIDFRTQMVIIVSGGVQETLNHSVELLGTSVKGQEMTVAWRLNKPDPKAIKQLKFNHPAQIAVVPRFEGQVKFVEK